MFPSQPRGTEAYYILRSSVRWVFKWLLVGWSVAQSCPALCGPMDCSMPGLPVFHHLPEFAQNHVHQVGDAVQPSHPLLPSSPFAWSLSQHQGNGGILVKVRVLQRPCWMRHDREPVPGTWQTVHSLEGWVMLRKRDWQADSEVVLCRSPDCRQAVCQPAASTSEIASFKMASSSRPGFVSLTPLSSAAGWPWAAGCLVHLGWGAAALVSTHHVPQTTPPHPNCDNQKCLWMSSYVPCWQSHPWLRTTARDRKIGG